VENKYAHRPRRPKVRKTSIAVASFETTRALERQLFVASSSTKFATSYRKSTDYFGAGDLSKKGAQQQQQQKSAATAAAAATRARGNEINTAMRSNALLTCRLAVF
jgi:hypothetical protein